MPLIIDNPDWQAVREGFGDETVDFWDIPDHVAMFFPLAQEGTNEEPAAEELCALVSDYRRVNEQARKLCELLPHHTEKYRVELAEAVAAIEKKIKKLLGNKVAYQAPAAAVASSPAAIGG